MNNYRLQPPSERMLNAPSTHMFLSSTGEWFYCRIVNERLILINDPAYPLAGISKFTRMSTTKNNARLVKLEGPRFQKVTS